MPKPRPLKAGDKAPSFEFRQDGKTLSIGALAGPCLLYFYPKDDTPGCTKQACGLRDAYGKFEDDGIQVVGVSKDDTASHDKFREKYGLPFPLIADTELELARAFGVYGEKKFMGKTYDGIHRMSFLIDTDGTIIKTYPKVKPAEHADAVLEDFMQLNS